MLQRPRRRRDDRPGPFEARAQDYLIKSEADFERVNACIEEHFGDVH